MTHTIKKFLFKTFPISLFLIVSLNASKLNTPSSFADNDMTNTKVKEIIGAIETVRINPGNMLIPARIDTGANTTSIDAQNLQITSEDDIKWATFSLNGETVKHKIVKFIRIKQHGNDARRRPVIRLNITLANTTQAVEVSLTDRSNFKYKALIGVNFLFDNFIVDVSQKHTSIPIQVQR